LLRERCLLAFALSRYVESLTSCSADTPVASHSNVNLTTAVVESSSLRKHKADGVNTGFFFSASIAIQRNFRRHVWLRGACSARRQTSPSHIFVESFYQNAFQKVRRDAFAPLWISGDNAARNYIERV